MIDSWATGVTGAVVLIVIGGLVFTRISADLVLLGGVAGLLLLGVLEPVEAIAGFGNPAVFTVALLYVVAAGLRETGALEEITGRLLGHASKPNSARARLLIPVAVASAFVSNTPIVAMLMPSLSNWARRRGVRLSSLLMPLSFAAILGGMCSLIGTSTNLVVHGLLLEQAEQDPDIRSMGMFTVAWVGIPASVVGLAYLFAIGRWLIPAGAEARSAVEDTREYATAMRLLPTAPIVGQTIEQAGLRHLSGLYLTRIERVGETVVAVGSDEILEAEDVLVFVGAVDSVVDLRRIRGLEPVADGGEFVRPTVRDRPALIEAVVAPQATFIGETVREAEFRTRYGAAIVAVARRGERIEGKIGDIRLRAGDTLLLEAKPEFVARIRGSWEFYLASPIAGAATPRHGLAKIALAILAGMIAMIAWQPEHAMTFALAAGLGMVLFRCCTSGEARAAVDLQVLLVIGAAFGIARALDKTGLAAGVAQQIIDLGAPWGVAGLLTALYLVTALLTSVVTNNAAAILMFPVGLAVAREHGLDFMPFAICLAIAASAGFATPIGYQTNLMVMGPGGYRTRDFLRIGAPLTLLVGLVCVVTLTILYGGGPENPVPS